MLVNKTSKSLPIWGLYSRVLREAAPMVGELAAILIMVLFGVLLTIAAPYRLGDGRWIACVDGWSYPGCL
jgi:hypothetical protein